MHPDLEKLIPLQELDIEARRLSDEIHALPQRLAQSEAVARNAAERQASVSSQINKEETVRRRLESDIADLRTKMERARKKIDTATTNIQLTALEHEVEFARVEISRMEDAELESMERSEGLESSLAAIRKESLTLEAALQQQRERSLETLRHDRSALAEVDQKREGMRSEIVVSDTGEATLARYDRISKAKGTAISEASLGKCTACGMMVRPQLWQDLRDNGPDSPSRQTIAGCENCGRMLYYDPARDAPQRKPVKGESIAASIVRSSL